MRRKTVVSMAVALACLAGCTMGPDSPRGFHLPEGNPEAGRVAFAELRCNDCHAADGVEHRDPEGADIVFPLGGRSTRITTYAELLTSIINPSHKLAANYPRKLSSIGGVSRMHNYNDVMTVQELVDIVAFLQPQYEVIVVTPMSYENYYP